MGKKYGRFYCIYGIEHTVTQQIWGMFVMGYFSVMAVLGLLILCLGEWAPFYSADHPWNCGLNGKGLLKYPVAILFYPLKLSIKCLANKPGHIGDKGEDEDIAQVTMFEIMKWKGPLECCCGSSRGSDVL